MEADGKTFDRELIHNYVVAYGRGGPSSEAYELAEKWFWQGKAESDIAFEIFFRGLTVQEEVEQNGG
ncbi:hypothetical protein [Marinobacterium aestuariivivens]|uniref:Uncharacterized protein n=1 Tax=Marinobacterium aestuariivivens TaxID=1698799 RepID=A0ABW2AA68_9GAMM